MGKFALFSGVLALARWMDRAHKVVPLKKVVEEEKRVREELTEKEIDKMVDDTFPASDPPSTY